MGDPSQTARERLDSWKAIADYLRRDVATVRRWEKALGLPVRRVPGGRGTSVFAYASEIDAWLKNARPSESSPQEASAAWRGWSVAAGLLVVAGGVLWWVVGSRASESPVRVRLGPSAIVAVDAAGAERWRYLFPDGERLGGGLDGRPEAGEVLSGKDAGFLVGTASLVRIADETVRSGQLLWFSPRGALERTFSFDDQLRFGASDYGAPWGITDFRVNGEGDTRRVAVVAHHFQWWPSMLTVLDNTGRRHGTFANAGWMERVHWLSPARLLTVGFSEALDGGMIALLDANALDGQSPVPADSRFYCASCGAGRPLRYIVLPRSEVNRATSSPFNRAWLQFGPDRIIVRSIEVPAAGAGPAADALYEFTPSLDLVRASFSDRYWELHHELEAQGQLHHTREQCPDKDGPREIQVWEPRTGWRTQKISTKRPS